MERYANEAVAHASIEETRTVLTYAELNAAIDQIGGLMKKYRAGAAVAGTVPIALTTIAERR